MNTGRAGAGAELRDGSFLRRAALTGLVLATLWWLLTDADPASWLIGVPCLLAAVATTSLFPTPPALRLRPLGFLRFSAFFLSRSLSAGLDVAWRACHPALPLQPGLHRYRLRLPVGPPRTFVINVVNLLPGSLSSDVDGDLLTLHLLDVNTPIVAEMQALEQHVAALFGVALSDPGPR